MKKIAISLLTLAAATSAFAQTTQTCASVDEKQIAGLFDRWNASLKTLDPSRVVANYTADAVLLATVQNQPRLTQDDRLNYFTKFLKLTPQGTINSSTIKIGCNTASDVGTYTFKLKDGSQVAARYSYIYSYQNGEWLISHHHSSAMPEKI
jgi:uncharacterized protein (TIGR02246 family)